MKGCYLSILAVFLFSLLHAQYQLSGVLTNQNDGSAMAGAAIYLKGTFLGTYTNEKGEFRFNKLSEGNYILVISYLGFENLEKPIEIHENLHLKLSLKESGIIQDEVIIRASTADSKTPATYSNLEAVEIEKINHSKDLPYLLNHIPSIVSTSDAGSGIGYTTLRIRGTDMSRINISLNGIPLNDAESQSVYFVDIPDFSSSIERIQIQRGVGTSGNGPAAFGASINIQSTGLKEKAYAELINSIGSFNSLRNTLKAGSGLINEQWTVDVRLSKISSDGYIDRASSDLKSMYLNTARYGKKSMLKFHVFSGTGKTYQAWNGVPSEMNSITKMKPTITSKVIINCIIPIN
jgi:iron complex outermembrane recepter protein